MLELLLVIEIIGQPEFRLFKKRLFKTVEDPPDIETIELPEQELPWYSLLLTTELLFIEMIALSVEDEALSLVLFKNMLLWMKEPIDEP